MLARGRTEEAEAVIARTEREVEESTREPLPAPRAEIPDEKGTGRLTDLFKGRHLRRTAVLSGLWFVACYVNHGIATWLPSLCTDAFGVDLTAALTFSLISNATGLLGTFLMALLIDRIGRRTSLLVALTGASPALAVLAVLAVVDGIMAACGSLRLVLRPARRGRGRRRADRLLRRRDHGQAPGGAQLLTPPPSRGTRPVPPRYRRAGLGRVGPYAAGRRIRDGREVPRPPESFT